MFACSAIITAALRETRRAPVKYPHRAVESEIAGRLSASALSDGTVRASQRSFSPMIPEPKKSAAPAAVPKKRLYAAQERISFRDSERIFSAFAEDNIFAVSLVEARLIPEQASVTAKE